MGRSRPFFLHKKELYNKNMKHKKKKTYGRRTPSPSTHPRDRLPREHKDSRRKEIYAEGRFTGTKSGYGFVDVDGSERDIFIPAEKTGGAIDGDLVAVRYHTYMSGETLRTDGEITKILDAARTTIIGTVYEEFFIGRAHRRSPRYLVEPSDTRFSQEIILAETDGVRPGDKVEVILPPRGAACYGELRCTLKRNFGRANSREANYEAILAECGIPVEFEETALTEATRVAEEPLTCAGRHDRRKEIIFTIDGAGAKDLDDAISLTNKEDGTWVLGVHIADVSHYVRPKTALDRASLARGTSVYFTDKVVPMLPVALSNGACSLNAGEDKYAMTCEMEIAADGTLGTCRIERSLIRSCVRGVYTEVNDLFANGTVSEFYGKYQEVYPTLVEMQRLYLVLAEKSRARGALDLEQSEAEILLDENGFPTEIIPRTRGDAEKLIEQFMLAANESVATYLQSRELPCVYRIHEEPNSEKLAEFALFAHNMGFDTSYITATDPAGCDFARLLEDAKARGLGEAISYTLLRTMAKAHYSDICHPHFGLGIARYCHFTSPIRRLSDLATHRLIGAVLLAGEPRGKYTGYAHRAAEAASETELRALTAERRIDALYKTLYLSRRIGEEYPATVSSVTRFGVFAALDNTCEGLIPLTELPGAWFFDEGNMNVRAGDDTLTIGDRITIRVEEADISRGKVRFALVSLPPRHTSPAASSSIHEAVPKKQAFAPQKKRPSSAHASQKGITSTRGKTSAGKPRKGTRGKRKH